MPRNTRRTSTLAAAPPPSGRNRRISRRAREERQRRYLTIGIAVVSAIVVLIAVISSLSFYVITPNETLATVNGHNISRSDYWKARRNVLLDRLQQYSFQSQLGGGSSDQLQAGADAARMEIASIRTYAVDPPTLTNMVQDQVVLDALPGLGITISDKDVNDTVAERFAPVPLNTPTPAPTLNPTRQATADAATAGATQTTVALNTQSTSTAQVGATQTATASALTPTSNAPPAATAPPTETAVPSQTPTNMEARATSTATLKEFITERQKDAGISLDDYKRLIIKPALARQRTREVLEARSPDHGEEVHAYHILLPTEDAAKEARRRVVEQGQDFGAVASELSTDTTTKPNGGDLGYAPRGIYVKPFEDAAFALPVGAVSDPVQTEFGWHIIKVTDHPQDRTYDDSVYRQLRDKQFQAWLDDQTAKAKVKETIPTPIPSPQAAFQPPADAPATPTFTPAPSPAVSGTPDATSGTPNLGAIGTPVGMATPPAGAAGVGGVAPTVMGSSSVTGTPAASGGGVPASGSGSGSGTAASGAAGMAAAGTTGSGGVTAAAAGSTPSAAAGAGPTPIPFTPASPSAGAGGVAPVAPATTAPTVSAPTVPPVIPATVAPPPTPMPIIVPTAAPAGAARATATP